MFIHVLARLQMSILTFCVHERNLSPPSCLGCQMVEPTFPFASKISSGDWDAFSRVEGLVDEPYGCEASALRITSGDIQKASHHMTMLRWLQFDFSLRPLPARALGMTGKIAPWGRFSSERKLFPAQLSRSLWLLRGACSFANTSAFTRPNARISQ